MIVATEPLAGERKLSGTTLVVLAFVMGTLVALLPMYYVYTSRDTANGGAGESSAALPSLTAATPAREATRDGPLRFAARMTYELSHTPAELPAAPLRVTAGAESALPVSPVIAPSSGEPAPRVQNARPIIAAPPDPRDTTRAMENEARRPEYREPPRSSTQAAPALVQPRIVEGRDLIVPNKPVTTRPIGAPELGSAGRGAEAPTRLAVATPSVGGSVHPIGSPPEPKAEAQKARAEAAPLNADVLGNRLSATRDWLAGAAQTTHTIQLMGGSEEHLRGQLRALTKLLEPSKIYVFRTLAQGKPSMTVLYGAYADRQAALQALDKLPAPVAANKPVLRTVNGIRAEQKQHGIDS